MGPRIKLAMLFGGVRAALASGKAPTRRQLLALSASLQGWAGALLLPLLSPEQRLQMARGELPGMAELFLSLRDLLLSCPDLQKALDMTAESFEALRQKGLELFTICERAEDIAEGADAAQAAIGERIEQIATHVAATAERLQSAPGTGEADRGQLAGALDGLDRYRKRCGDKKLTVKARTQRALAPLREAQIRSQARRAIVKLSSSVLRGAGVEAEAPLALLRTTPDTTDAPLTPVPPRQPPRRRAPSPDALLEPAGAPLEQCLEAPVAQFLACAAELQAARDGLLGLHLRPAQPRPLDSLGSLELGDEALLLAQALRTSNLLQKESGITPEQIEDLCGLRGALATVQQSAELLARRAGDGRLALGTLLVLCCEETFAWAEARLKEPGLGEEERGRLGAEVGSVREALRRAGEPGRRRQARTLQRASALSREVEGAAAEEQADTIVEKLRAGESVGVAELQLADSVQRRRARKTEAALTAPIARRRRPR